MGLQSFAAGRALLPLIGALALTACGGAEKAAEDGYKTQFVDSFTATCQASATNSGAPAEIASGVCRCAANALVARYGPAELLSLSDEKALPVMKRCAEQAGLAV